jgi:hypothetical protein
MASPYNCELCTLPAKMLCVRCGRKLCHMHETNPSNSLAIAGHYAVPNEGIVCAECYKGGKHGDAR